jgi:hypothetical protein
VEEDRAHDLPDRAPARDVRVPKFGDDVGRRVLVGEERPEFRPDEAPGDGALRVGRLEEDADGVVAVPVAAPAQDRLNAAVVERRVVDEGCAVVLVRLPVVLDGPAGERPRDLADVVLGVVAQYET